jgi:hypothetical protein
MPRVSGGPSGLEAARRFRLMRRPYLVPAALIAMMGLIGTARVQAQGINPNIPTPAPSTIFPINQPATFRYTDQQGVGTITLTDLGLDQTTGFDILRVTIAQNGLTYSGSGIGTPIPGAVRPLNNLVSFSVISSAGIAYFFEGKMGLGVEFQGQGTYFPVNNPTQIQTWGLLFTPNPGPPQATTLTLNLDRGCGSFYPIGASQVITFSASTNDTVSLLNQRSDGTFVLISNQPVVAGQTYAYSTFVGSFVGQRTLILRDTAGVQVSCTFFGG